MNHEQSVYQGTIGDFSRITSAYFRGPKFTVPPPEPPLHGWQGPQGLTWILQKRERRQHAADVAATVKPCLLKIGRGGPGLCN